MFLLRLLPVILLFILSPVQAEPPDTATALAEAVIPPRDRIDLAQRLSGLGEIAPPPENAPLWQLGHRKSFWVINNSANRSFEVTAQLHTIGRHIYLWVEEGVSINTADMATLARLFDEAIYPAMHTLFGSEASPGIDGDPRIYALFTYGQGTGTVAYFYSQHSHPAEAVPASNEHEMFFFNLDYLGVQDSVTGEISFTPETIAAVLAHEFQHMVHYNQDMNESIWLNEGLSKLAEVYTGFQYNTDSIAQAFLLRSQTQLNDWPEERSTIPHYGAAFLFVTYFYDRYGADALRMLVQHPANGLEAVDSVLATLDEPDVNTFFADWVAANAIMDSTLQDGRYGYVTLPHLYRSRPQEEIRVYPFSVAGRIPQYATSYYTLTPPAEATTLTLDFTMPGTVDLVPTTPASGQWMWYSNKADNSDTTLTRAFDLRQTATATLHYALWYHIENLWDYGYVMVSTDDGATWEILQTPHKTNDNPHFTAYGPGYTGYSEDWLEETISLDAYAGQEILIRFEMITDDATTQPGMLIDDIRIPEIGYSSDFEVDDGGWEPRGWILSDNSVPQQVWVQLIQQTDDDVLIERWAATGPARWQVALSPDATEVTLAISPYAPLTTITMPYTLQISME